MPEIILIEVGFRAPAGAALSEAQIQAMIDKAVADALAGGVPVVSSVSAATVISSQTIIKGAE